LFHLIAKFEEKEQSIKAEISSGDFTLIDFAFIEDEYVFNNDCGKN